MQFVDPPHQRQVGVRHRLGRVVGAAPADAEQFRLPGQGNIMVPVDHRFALSFPALLSAPDKKSISSACWPILACRALRSTTGSFLPSSPPNTLAARSKSWLRHSPIWVGWISNSCANSARVFSPRRAARATLALKLAEWLRRGRLLIVCSSPSALPTPSGSSLST